MAKHTNMSTASTKPEESPYTHLIIVCCHAIYTGNGSDLSESQWILKPYQISDPKTGRPSEHETFITHILAGARAIEDDKNAMLTFSGGFTGDSKISEAGGYRAVLKSLRDHDILHDPNYFEEELATDSFQNLLFSILQFQRVTGRYPERVTVITHAFKQKRFLELHAPAIKWPANRIRVRGVNPPFTHEELKSTEKGEAENAYELFVKDPYGVRPPLSEKREARHWERSNTRVVFPGLDPVLGRLLMWEGGESGREVFPERLPWEE